MADSILDKIISSKNEEEISHFAPQEILTRLLEPLPNRDRDIVIRRFGLRGDSIVTLEEIGKALEVTRERVRQIEQSAIRKIQAGPQYASTIATIEHVARQYLEESGGALAEDELIEKLVQGRDREKEARAILYFFLHELLSSRLQHLDPQEHLNAGWALRFFDREKLTQQITTCEEILRAKNTPLDQKGFFHFYGERVKDHGDETQFASLLRLAARISRNAFGEWGFSEWATVSPKRMRDKIYLVLKRHGKPLHFNEITERINEARFDQKIAHAPTVHNELIIDDRFVLVGRGIYALTEWGFKRGVVADIVAAILQEKAQPLDRNTIVAEVLKQRMVGKTTVHLALMNRNRFTKLPDGKYTLAAIGK